MTNQQDKLYKQLIEAGGDAARPNEELKQRVLQASLRALSSDAKEAPIDNDVATPALLARLVPDASCGSGNAASREAHRSAEPPSRRRFGRLLMATHTRSVRYGAVAATAVILAIIGLWPNHSGKPGEKWWLAPPSAWAGQIEQVLGSVKGITGREQTIWIRADGSHNTSSTWDKFYSSSDSYRRDIYDGQTLREIQWYVADGDGMIQTGLRYDLHTYWPERHKGNYGTMEPIDRMRSMVSRISRADRLLGTQPIDGRECVGFEIRASQYGDNPDTWLDRIWFDAHTRLPVQIERERPHAVPQAGITGMIEILDQFDWNPTLPEDTFTPKIPTSYTRIHPDQLSSATNQPAQ